METGYRQVYLQRNEERRIMKGELWVYRDQIAGDSGDFLAGEVVKIYSWQKHYLATAFINSASAIPLRVLGRREDEVIDRAFFKARIKKADDLRKTIRPENTCYRLAFGDADRLPGLVIDRFDDYFVVQVTTAGMEKVKADIFSIIDELYPGSVIIEKSQGALREKENLAPVNQVVTAGREAEKEIDITGVRFKLNFLKAQKTGFFLDQRDNYLLLEHISNGREVLDVFSYAGAWGLFAYRFGAKTVTFLETSADYLDQTRENILLNGFNPGDFSLQKGDAVPLLKEMVKDGQKKDVVILDPPAFIKSRHNKRDGLRGYKEINLRALHLIRPGGFLISCSCSHFFSREEFLELLAQAGRDAGRRLQLLAYRTQPDDHPVALPLLQSEYLKCALLSVD